MVLPAGLTLSASLGQRFLGSERMVRPPVEPMIGIGNSSKTWSFHRGLQICLAGNDPFTGNFYEDSFEIDCLVAFHASCEHRKSTSGCPNIILHIHVRMASRYYRYKYGSCHPWLNKYLNIPWLLVCSGFLWPVSL